MSVISPTDATSFRNAKQVQTKLFLNLVPLTVVASAEIATTPTSYPLAELSVINTVTWSEIGTGQAFTIKKPSGAIVTWGVQRKTSTASVFYMDAKSRGDGGYARDIALPIEAGDTLEIYAHRPAWGLLSRATGSAIYKKWDVQYNGEGFTPEPVVIMGGHRHAISEENGYGRISFDASESYDWAQGTAGITDYDWDFPVSAQLVSGGLGQSTVTIDLPEGAHNISCTITSINGRQSTGYRWVFVNPAKANGGAGDAFSQIYGLSAITGDTSDRSGREVTFEVKGDASEALYPGAMCLLTYYTTFDGVEIATETIRGSFFGYLGEIRGEGKVNYFKTANLTFYSGLKLAEGVPVATQLMQEAVNPTDWTQVATTFSNPAFGAYYCLKHHSTFLYNHDYIYHPDIESKRRKVFGFKAESVAGQLEFLEKIAVGEFNCHSDGTLEFIPQPDHMESADRNLIDERFTWTASDIKPPLTVEPKLMPDVSRVIMDAISHDGSQESPTYRAIAPGYASGQGRSSADEPDIIVTPVNGQLALEKIVGHRYAFLNNPLSNMPLLPLVLFDILDPASLDWHLLLVDERYLAFSPNQFGIDWNGSGNGMRFRPVNVSIVWKLVNNVLVPSMEASIRVTTFGLKGEFLPIERYEGWQWQSADGWYPDYDDTYYQDTPDFDDLDEQYAFVVAWNHNGDLGATGSFLSESVEWIDAKNPDGSTTERLEGKVLSMDWSRSIGAPRAWAVSWVEDDNELRVYHTLDITAEAVNWNLDETYTVTDTFVGIAEIRSSSALTAVAWLSTDGVRTARYDGSWGGIVAVGSTAYTDENAGIKRLGLKVGGSSDNEVWVFGVIGDEAYKYYTATGVAGGFSAVANHPGTAGNTSNPSPLIERASDAVGNLLIYNFENEDGSDDVQFPSTITQTIYLTALESLDLTAPTQMGFDRVYQTSEQIAGVRYDITEIELDVNTSVWYRNTEGDPPGLSGTPEVFFPPGTDPSHEGTYELYKVEVTVQIYMLDKNNVTLWADEFQFHSLDTSDDYTITYAPSPMSFTRVRFNAERNPVYTFASPIEGVAKFRLVFKTDNIELLGGFTDDSLQLSTFSMVGSIDHVNVDNKVESGTRVYKVNPSAVWSDVTPDDEATGNHPLALSVQNFNTYWMVATNIDGSRKIVKTVDGGLNWTTVESSTAYTWIKYLTNDVLLAGGHSRIDLVTDAFDNAYPRVGNYGQAVGQVGTIDGALILVEA